MHASIQLTQTLIDQGIVLSKDYFDYTMQSYKTCGSTMYFNGSDCILKDRTYAIIEQGENEHTLYLRFQTLNYYFYDLLDQYTVLTFDFKEGLPVQIVEFQFLKETEFERGDHP